MNVLVLSAGTRCRLISYFKEKNNGFDRVVATDCSIYAPAVYMADSHYIVPRMHDNNYLPTLMDICKKEEINVVLPLQEDEIEHISENRAMFEALGILVAISDIETLKVCRDKYLLYKTLSSKGVSCVETYDYNTEKEIIVNMTLPVLAKDRFGAGSIGMLKIGSWPLLMEFAKCSEKEIIVQPYLDAREYGVDAYIDFVSGEIIAVFAKEKIRMRAGETEKSKSIIDWNLFELVKVIVRELNFRGSIDIDVFKYGGAYHVLEVNPRFGGGYPHAYECGVNFIKFIETNARGQYNTPVIGKYEENTALLKFTDAMLKNEKDMF
jgi:carbamoyl-phosphate synthase large subunit